MIEKTKEKLLEHYQEREPVKFIQYDVFTEEFDDIVIPDKDGYSLWAGRTQELMSGNYAIRVLLKPDTKKELIIKGLEKVIDWIRTQPEHLKWSYKEADIGPGVTRIQQVDR